MILLTLFTTFFKIGAFTFGGGYAMLPLIQEQALVHGWLSAEQLVNFIAVSESTPGPFAINIATYVGRTTAGIPGAICATIGVILPSFIIILLVAGCYEKFKNSKIVSACMSGLRPAVIGLIAAAALSIGKTVLVQAADKTFRISAYSLVTQAVIFAVAVFLMFKKKAHPIIVILLSALLGIVFGYARIYAPV